MALPDRKRGISVEFQPMSPEDVERTMQCLLHQQARFEANIATISEKTDRVSEGLVGLTVLANQTERKVRDLADSVGTVRDGINALTGIVGRMSERIEHMSEGVDQGFDRVAEVQHRQAEAGERLDRRLDRLEKSQERTDQQIKKLGAHFERHLRRNHRRRPS